MSEQIEIFENTNIEEVTEVEIVDLETSKNKQNQTKTSEKEKEKEKEKDKEKEIEKETYIVPVSETQISNRTVWNDKAMFAATLEMATALSKSSLVPANYKDKPGNCLIALDFANRMNMPPLMIMQNLYIVNGNPAWSGQACVSLINNCGRFEPLCFEEFISDDLTEFSCRAYAKDKRTGEILYSTKIDNVMAKECGWLTKPGSYWTKMPAQMARYRAAAYFARTYCPEVLMGLYTDDEQRDIHGYEDKPETKTYRR